jgi:uncharacterized protein YjlB
MQMHYMDIVRLRFTYGTDVSGLLLHGAIDYNGRVRQRRYYSKGRQTTVTQDRALTSLDPRFKGVLQTPQIVAHLLTDDGTYPNNRELPLLAYQGALCLAEQPPEGAAVLIEALIRANGWGGSWRNGVYGYHHYHSTAHEVLGVCSGTVEVQFGGQDGVVVSIARGDVVIIPAGVAHKNQNASRDFYVVGAYPRGQHPDMNYGRAGERPRADEIIARVPLPTLDPIYGATAH